MTVDKTGVFSSAFRPTGAVIISNKYLTIKGSTYSITERRVPELIAVLGSQPVSDVSHKPGGMLLLLSARPAVTLTNVKAATNFAAC